jgi:hypothetical protein
MWQMFLKSLKFSEPLNHHYILRLLLPFQLQYLDLQQIGTSVGNGPNFLHIIYCLYGVMLHFYFKTARSFNCLISLWLEHSTKSEMPGRALSLVFFKILRSVIWSYVKIHTTLKKSAASFSEALVPIGHNALRYNTTRPTF